MQLYFFVGEASFYRHELAKVDISKRYDMVYDWYDKWGKSRVLHFYAANYIRKKGDHTKYMDTICERCGGYRCFASADTVLSYGKSDRIAKIWMSNAKKTVQADIKAGKFVISAGNVKLAMDSRLNDREQSFIKYQGEYEAARNAENQQKCY